MMLRHRFKANSVHFFGRNTVKTFVLASTVALSLISGEAMSACADPRLSPTAISQLLGGNTVCVPAVTANPMTWQELHVGNNASTTGALIDFKRGPVDPVDPSETVGTWTVNGNGIGNSTVTHNYGSGGSFTYTVHGTGAVGTNHSFCNGAIEIVGRVKSSGGAC